MKPRWGPGSMSLALSLALTASGCASNLRPSSPIVIAPPERPAPAQPVRHSASAARCDIDCPAGAIGARGQQISALDVPKR